MGIFSEYNLSCYESVIIKIDKFNKLTKTNNNNFSMLASMPILALTVEQAFCNLIQLKPDMNVLIHAGAGGIGLMATQYAIMFNCNVFITCSDEKRKYINPKIIKISSSRDPEIFLQDFKDIKFDVVLNSLSNNFIKYSFDMLKDDGVNLLKNLFQELIKNISKEELDKINIRDNFIGFIKFLSIKI